MKTAYHYDYKTLIYQGQSQIHEVPGYDNYILPQFSTWVAKPDFDEETEQANFDVKNQKWLVELKLVEAMAYHKQTREPKVFDDESLVTDEYTLKKPLTPWDEWMDGGWITNESNRYIDGYNNADDTRRHLYLTICDPLMAEANIKRLQGHEIEAKEYEQQALFLRVKIQQENPYPIMRT